jgi:hypothetical protein
MFGNVFAYANIYPPLLTLYQKCLEVFADIQKKEELPLKCIKLSNVLKKIKLG